MEKSARGFRKNVAEVGRNLASGVLRSDQNSRSGSDGKGKEFTDCINPMRRGRLQRAESSHVPSSTLGASEWFGPEERDAKALLKRSGKRFSAAPRFESSLDPRDAYEYRNDIGVESSEFT